MANQQIILRSKAMVEWAVACYRDRQVLYRGGSPQMVTMISLFSDAYGSCYLSDVLEGS